MATTPWRASTFTLRIDCMGARQASENGRASERNASGDMQIVSCFSISFFARNYRRMLSSCECRGRLWTTQDFAFFEIFSREPTVCRSLASRTLHSTLLLKSCQKMLYSLLDVRFQMDARVKLTHCSPFLWWLSSASPNLPSALCRRSILNDCNSASRQISSPFAFQRPPLHIASAMRFYCLHPFCFLVPRHTTSCTSSFSSSAPAYVIRCYTSVAVLSVLETRSHRSLRCG